MSPPHPGHGYIDYVGDEEHFWRVETLWAAAAAGPVVETPLDEIPWREDGCYVLGDPPTWGAFAAHMARALRAALDYPIVIGPGGDVMDGMHRILRAHAEGRATIRAVRLRERPPPDRVRPR